MAEVAHTLKRRQDFLRLARGRRKAAAPGIVVQLATTPDNDICNDAVRFGFTASRKVGNAVARNRAKRRMRTLASSALPQLPGGHDLVLIARAATVDRPYDLLQRDFANCLKRLGLKLSQAIR
ncbi:MAG: ribonuclease P protein component [Pseudomonadota bacterium]